MYGTVFRFRLKPGVEQQFLEHVRAFEANPPRGFVGAWTYRLDKGGDEYITAAAHSDKEAYQENANSQRQAEWYQGFRAFLVDDPEWNDGEIVAGEAR